MSKIKKSLFSIANTPWGYYTVIAKIPPGSIKEWTAWIIEIRRYVQPVAGSPAAAGRRRRRGKNGNSVSCKIG